MSQRPATRQPGSEPTNKPGSEPASDPWHKMRLATQARIGLGRSGHAMPTSALLQFQSAHALARDAVHAELNVPAVTCELSGAVIVADSAAPGRAVYLQRPDLGRTLAAESRSRLLAVHAETDPAGTGYDVVFVLADGLSALAVEQHAAQLLQATRNLLPTDWTVGPTVIARQARVALGDEVAELLQARMVVVLIGERPGLSSSDSLSVYLTYAPRVGRLDSERNCISNVRPPMGQSISEAAATLVHLMAAARALELTGTGLKDDFVSIASPPGGGSSDVSTDQAIRTSENP